MTDLTIDGESPTRPWIAQGDLFPVVLLCAGQSRRATIVGGEVRRYIQIPENTICTITATLRDAIFGTGSGAITFTITGAVRQRAGVSGSQGKYAQPQISFDCVSSDGVTDPVGITQIP